MSKDRHRVSKIRRRMMRESSESEMRVWTLRDLPKIHELRPGEVMTIAQTGSSMILCGRGVAE